MAISRGDIVRADIPYRDSNGEFKTKERPALVLSDGQHNLHRKDVIVAKITTVKKQNLSQWDVVITDLEGCGLRKSSKIVCDSIHTVSSKYCSKPIGKASPEIMKEVSEKVQKLFRWRP